MHGAVFLPWIAFTLSNVAFKLSVFSAREAFDGVPARSLGLVRSLVLVRQDLLLAGFALPLAVWCLTLLMSDAWQRAASATIVFVLQIVLAAEVLAYQAFGTFLPADTLRRVGHWLLTSHDATLVVVPRSDWYECLFWTAIVLLLCAAATFHPNFHSPKSNFISVVAFVVLVVATAAAWVPRTRGNDMSSPVLKMAKTGLLGVEDTNISDLGRSLPELLNQERLSAHVPSPEHSAYFGSARGYNVLLFVIESTPAHVVDPAIDSLSDLPNLAGLRSHAFVMSKHYTPYPLTDRALFSIFTSMYSQCTAGEAIPNRQVTTPGLVRAMQVEGYKTGYYGFVWKDERDDRMLSSFGFSDQVQPTWADSQTGGAAESFNGDVHRVEAKDLEVLQKLRSDLHTWAAQKQPFLAAFLPQIGHDPWRELQAGHWHNSTQRGRALVAVQDAWLGWLIQDLKSEGLLDHTIIVFTSDHGERREVLTPGEAPHVVFAGRLDDRALRVPMMIYVPRVLARTMMIDAATSHIDVQPTILDLLGITSSRELEQGMAVWNSKLANRRIFMATAGAEGFCGDGIYYMKTDLGSIAKSQKLQFDGTNRLDPECDEARGVRSALTEHDTRERAIVQRVLQNPPTP